jgi:hypothetical protein
VARARPGHRWRRRQQKAGKTEPETPMALGVRLSRARPGPLSFSMSVPRHPGQVAAARTPTAGPRQCHEQRPPSHGYSGKQRRH